MYYLASVKKSDSAMYLWMLEMTVCMYCLLPTFLPWWGAKHITHASSQACILENNLIQDNGEAYPESR